MGPRGFSGEGLVRFYPAGARRRPGLSYRTVGDFVGYLVGATVALVLCLGLSAAFGPVGFVGGGMVSIALFYPILLISRFAWPLSLVAASLAAVALISFGHTGMVSPAGPAPPVTTPSQHR
jgi:hypothetical protein